MTAEQLLSAAIQDTGSNVATAAQSVGLSALQLSQKLYKETIKASDFLKIIESLDVDIILINKKNGKRIIPVIPGEGPRIEQMVDRVLYDTRKSSALSNNFGKDGEEKYPEGHAEELYVNKDDGYFFAEYTQDDDGTVTGKIRPTTANIALAFIKQYGYIGRKEDLTVEDRVLVDLYAKASVKDRMVINSILDEYRNQEPED